ncbi:protein kinase domain-containing protein [Pseudomonas sp. KCJK8751]|uniref:protein kinase domain-containing protein n=1 Tax=unclassified Pseudomonas TaxID=196821 RepID=UPI0039064F3B
MPKTRQRKPPATADFNGWSFKWEKPLGKGGNGIVYLATKDGQQGALKLLKSTQFPDRVTRFRDEVSGLRDCADIPGVIPVLDAETDPVGAQRPWLVMALATPVQKKLGDSPTLEVVVKAILEIARVLEAMHERGYTHRDIKPDNLFFHNDRWTVGDFGLVSFAGKEAETAPHERIGPVFYIAPEMLNTAAHADGSKADVFSLAKTLWVLATGQNFPLPGVYDLSHEAFRIGTYLPGAVGSSQLDKLIASATALTPEHRPTMSQVCTELRAWLSPKEELPLAIQFNTREFDSLIENSRNAYDAQRATKARNDEHLKTAALRIQQKLSGFIEEVTLAFRNANLETALVNWNDNTKQITLHAVVPDSRPALMTLQLSEFSLKASNIRFSAIVRTEWRESRTYALCWKRELEFLEGGSEEDLVLDDLQREMNDVLEDAVPRFLAVTYAPLSNCDSHLITVSDASGSPIDGAQVCVIGVDGAAHKHRTDENGRVVSPAVPPGSIAYVAHPNYHGTVIHRLSAENAVQLEKSAQGGSFIHTETGHPWTQLKARIQINHNDQGHMSMYATGAVMDFGVSQPAVISLGKRTHIKDPTGHCVHFYPQAARGDVFLVQVENLAPPRPAPDTSARLF